MILAQQLGIKAGSNVLLVGAPPDFPRSLEPLPRDVQSARRLSASVEIAHVFTTDKAELESKLSVFRGTLKPTAVVWVSWPRKSSGVPTQITHRREGLT